jgi:hypothetical protein
MTRRATILMLILVGILAAGFLYLHVLARRVSFIPPQHGEETARTRLSEVALQPAIGPPQTVTLYFPSVDQGVLLAETRSLALAANDTDRIHQILLALIEGSHQGHSRPLPPSTDVRAVFLTPDGTAYLDFSSDVLAGFAPGIASESLAIYSVVNSLTANIPTVKKVRLLLLGQEIETLHGHADLSDGYVPDLARVAPNP